MGRSVFASLCVLFCRLTRSTTTKSLNHNHRLRGGCRPSCCRTVTTQMYAMGGNPWADHRMSALLPWQRIAKSSKRLIPCAASRFVFGLLWCPRAVTASACAYCTPSVATAPSNRAGCCGCRRLPADPVTTSARPACISMTRDSIGFSKCPTGKSHAFSPQTKNMTWKTAGHSRRLYSTWSDSQMLTNPAARATDVMIS